MNGKKLAKVCLGAQYRGSWFLTFFMNDLFYLVKRGHLFNYADDNSVPEIINIIRRLLQSEAEVTVRWICSNAQCMEAKKKSRDSI